jgi:hypothetical protein
MTKSHYSPRISRFLVGVLYLEAKNRHIPMTKLANTLLAQSLRGSESWAKAQSTMVQENPSAHPDQH